MEKVSFSSGKFKLVGVLHLPSKPTKKAIIMAHGLRIDKDEGGIFIRAADKLTKLKTAAFRFDFRGCGESSGKFADKTISNDIEDLSNAFKFMKKQGYKEFGLLGASFGGGSAVLLLKNHPQLIKSLVLWSPALNYKSGIKKLVIPWLEEKIKEVFYQRSFRIEAERFDFSKDLIIQMIKYKPYKALEKIICPTLILHGDKDEKVPLEDSVKYHQLIRGPHKLEIIKNSLHGFHNPVSEKEAIRLTYNFFEKNL